MNRSQDRPQTQEILNQIKQLRCKPPKPQQHKTSRSQLEQLDVKRMRYRVTPKTFLNLSPSLNTLKCKTISQTQIQQDYLNHLLPSIKRKHIPKFSLFQQPQIRMKTDWINSIYRLF